MRKRRWWVVAFLAICAIALAIGLRWSSAHDALLGDWVEPIPGMEDHVQGFSLREAGVAESIDMATLRYLEWRVDGDALILAGESIGNGTSDPFEETYRIVSVEPDRLELVDAHGASRIYLRRGNPAP